MKILLFGTGKIYQAYKQWFDHYEITYLLDNDISKQGKHLDDIVILSPSMGVNTDYDAIFILSTYTNEMKKQLVSLGVNEDKIFYYYDIRTGMNKDVMFYGDKKSLSVRTKTKSKNKRILLITHNLETTGAEVVLLDAAKILKKNGYDVIVATQEDGPMRQSFVDEGILVIIDTGTGVFHLTSIEWINKLNPNIVLVNTIFMHHLFKCGAISIPVIWWLHDSEALYQWTQCECLNRYYHNNIHVYAVSTLAKEPFVARCPNWPIKLLPYGIRDINEPGFSNYNLDSDKLVFATIGAIAERKGQNVLFEAIRLLPNEERNRCEFWLIYQPIIASDYADAILEMSASIPEVKMIGQIAHEKMGEIYKKISALICPSTSDTLPTVTVEAMQSYCPCIVSDGTGTARYIENFKNGFVFINGDANALTEKILWIIHNKNKLPVMGKEARKTYEKNFSMEIFETNLMKAVKEAEI